MIKVDKKNRDTTSTLGEWFEFWGVKSSSFAVDQG